MSAADELAERIRSLETDLRRESRALSDAWEGEQRKVAHLRNMSDYRRTALKDAGRKARWEVSDAETAFRLSVELDQALAAVDGEVEAAERDSMDRQHRLKEERRRVSDTLKPVRAVMDELDEAQLSSYGLAPWDGVALKALRVLDGSGAGAAASSPGEGSLGEGSLGEGSLGEGSLGEGALLKASEVVPLFKEGMGISRSQFYRRFRPLLRSYALSPTRLVRHPDGWVELDGYNSTMRFRREEVEALLAFLRSSTAR